MKSPLIAILFLLQFALLQSVSSQELKERLPLDITRLPVKINSAFTFKIYNYPSPISISRNSNGTFFFGNFSTLMLTGSGSIHQYTAVSFTFKYPPQHVIATISQKIIEMQILYRLVELTNSTWRHKSLVVSISFVTTDYDPVQGLSISHQINKKFKNGSLIHFDKFLPLVPGLNMIIYKGIHSLYPEDKAFLWFIRPELLLMSRHEFQEVLELIDGNDDAPFDGVLKRLSDLNEIAETKEQRINPESSNQF